MECRYSPHNSFIVLYKVTCFTNVILRPFVKFINNLLVQVKIKILFFVSFEQCYYFSFSRNSVGRTKRLKA